MIDWVSLLQTFGLAVVILFAIGVAFWRITKWVAKEIIIPLRDKIMGRLIDFLGRIEGTVGKLDKNIDQVTTSLTQQAASLKELTSTNAGILDATAKVETAVRDKNVLIDDAVVLGKQERAEILAAVKQVHELSLRILTSLENAATLARGKA